MSSKAEKKRNRKAAQLAALKRGQKAGRPKKDGERYACGKLKPRRNDRVIDAKRELVGKDAAGKNLDIALAEDPLDFIHAKGWLSTARYRAALSYRDTRKRAGLGAPSVGASGIQETASTSGVEGRSFHDMNDSEIAEVFDHVFREEPEKTPEERQAESLLRWKTMEGAMNAAQSHQVGLIAVQGSWSFWMTSLNLGKELEGRHLRAKEDFEAGLDAILGALKSRKRPTTSQIAKAYISLVDPRPAKVEETLRFVDEDGDPVQMRSERGKPFAVARKVRA